MISPNMIMTKLRAKGRAQLRLGGLEGGKARASKLFAKRRREIAQNAARSRWEGALTH